MLKIHQVKIKKFREEKHKQSMINSLWKNTVLQVTYTKGRKRS